MGATKRCFYSENQIELSNIFKAFGHPARITIIESLLQHDRLNCNDIKYYVPLAQSTVSRHLQVLFETGILGSEIIGNHCFYKVNMAVVQDIDKYMSLLFDQVHPENMEINR